MEASVGTGATPVCRECANCMACNATRSGTFAGATTRCAEQRLTARLLALRVPLALAPLRVRLLPGVKESDRLLMAQDPSREKGNVMDGWMTLQHGELSPSQLEPWLDRDGGTTVPIPEHYAWSC